MKTMVSTAGSGLSGAPASFDTLAPGAKAGPWLVERELGRGGMGAVYAVVHEHIGKRAALKIVHQRLLVPGFNSDRMLLEAKVVNQVGHPNIVDIFETGKLGDGRPYIVMERLDGQTLSARADAGKLLPDFVIAVLLQVCDALTAAHAAGIVHRDLKLDNVFLVDNPEDPAMLKVKLLDWGIAKVLSHDVKHTIEGQLMGTPQYLAPEQARGHAVSPQTDVYSLGVMAYELFLEQLPFEAETAAEVMAMHLRLPPPPPSALWPDVPAALEDLLLAMLQKIPGARPTIAEVVRGLGGVLDELAQRRLAHAGRSAPYPTATPRDPSARRRAISAAELAKTDDAVWQARPKRWQYAIGALALVASAALFWISRLDDQAASAATTVTLPAAARKMAPVVSPDAGAAVTLAAQPMISDIELRPSPPVDAATPPRPIALPPLPAAARVEPRASAPAHAAHTPPTRSTASRPAPSHKPPVAPRRGPQVDPDGTLDPYR
jgi:eukaryotic-like serine/threonine-protein kinase